MIKLNEQDSKWADSCKEKLLKKMKNTAPKIKGTIPYSANNGKYDDRYKIEPDWWTNGFWGGMMWVLYDMSGENIFCEAAKDTEQLMENVFYDKYENLHHDVGFMWNITSGVHYMLDGDNKSKIRTLESANFLAGRFNVKGKYIRAWNGNKIGITIIDTMMNLPLLYRASEITGDNRYSYIAQEHADMVLRDHLRADGSVAHMADHNPITGECTGYPDSQGYSPDSSWSRGQAWAIYGFVLSYIHTHRIEYLDAAKRVAHYFIAACCEDFLPRCDFRAPEHPLVYDSSAGACAACGLIEISNCVPEFEKNMYILAAIRIIKALDKKCCDWDIDTESVLQMSTQTYSRVESRNINIIYGDYFFAEAIYKLNGGKMIFW